MANPPGSCPLPPIPPPAPPGPPPSPPKPLPPARTLLQFKWGSQCLTIDPPTCKPSYSTPCPLVIGSCADNASHWAERGNHMTHGATSSAAINIDCNRQEHGAVAKLLGSSPSQIIWKASVGSSEAESLGESGEKKGRLRDDYLGVRGRLAAGGSTFCLNNGGGSPMPPCGLDKALPTQVKLVKCTNESATGNWVRVIVS